MQMKDDYLTMHDADNCLLMKVKMNPNNIYKIKLNFGVPMCLYSKLNKNNWRWQARLGHMKFKSMKTMSKKGLVTGLPHFDQENKLCESCLVGKQTRKSFLINTSCKVKQPLDVVHVDL